MAADCPGRGRAAALTLAASALAAWHAFTHAAVAVVAAAVQEHEEEVQEDVQAREESLRYEVQQ